MHMAPNKDRVHDIKDNPITPIHQHKRQLSVKDVPSVFSPLFDSSVPAFPSLPLSLPPTGLKVRPRTRESRQKEGKQSNAVHLR